MKNKSNLKNVLKIGTIAGIIGLAFCNPSFAANTATVKVETANVRKTADASSKIVEQAYENEKVEILEASGNWYKVKYNNIEGYIKKDLLDVKDDKATENKSEEDKTNQTADTTVQEENTNTSSNTSTAQTATEEQENETEPEVELTIGKYTCKENMKLKLIPLILGNDINEIKKDSTVNVLEINNKWALVESGTNRGWVLVSKLEKVETTKNESTKKEETKKEDTKTEEKKETAKETTMYVNSEVVNLRKSDSTNSSVLSQLTKGTQVTVTGTSGQWSKVKVNGQVGYVLSSLLTSRKPETTTSRSIETPRKETTSTKVEKPSEAAKKVSTTSSTKTSTTSKTSTKKTSTTSNLGQQIVNYAKQFLGCKYVWGGTTPKGFDCTGFTQYVYKHFGITINRTAQEKNGRAVKKSELKLGDILIFTGHVGLYIGNNEFIHAANPRKGVVITSLSNSYYVKNYISARRIID